MKKKLYATGLCFTMISIGLLLVSYTPKKQASNYNVHEILNKVLSSIDNIKTMRYNLQCNERIKGRMQHTESQVKLQTSPRKLYLSLNGPEVLWVQGTNGGDALINPSAFPYID